MGFFGTAISVPLDLVLFSISRREISSSYANPKFGSEISRYPFLALSLPSLGISLMQAEEWRSIFCDILVNRQSIIIVL